MEEKLRRRCLRNNSNCIPIDNIFKNQVYVINSACSSIPIQILNKIKKFTSLTCDDINSLNFINNESNRTALQRMNEVYSLQKSYIQKRKAQKIKQNQHQNDEMRNIAHNTQNNQNNHHNQNQMMNQYYNSLMGGRHMIMSTLPTFEEEKDFRYIKSEEHQNQYNREGFLENRFTNDKQKSNNKEEILYNPMFRNDLQSLFYQ